MVEAAGAEPDLLDLTDDVLAGAAGFRLADYPDTWRHGDLVLPLSYRFDPGGPLDGVSVHVPLTALNQVDRRRASTGRSRVTAPSSSRRSCGRCPRTSGAS